MTSQIKFVGILNTTPDSYWDGGQYMDIEAAVRQAGELLKSGADIVEVGGESTGPDSTHVSVTEELKRVVPVIQALKQAYPQVQLSIDTYKSEVAEAALAVGAVMVNDITAGRADPALLSIVAQYDAKLVLMYAKDVSPRTTKQATTYADVVVTISSFLRERITLAQKAGVKSEQVILDPGLGHFISSDPSYSFEIIARLDELLTLGYPLFLSPSRKSFLAGSEALVAADRLPGTIIASALAVLHGATYIRTHDVAAVRRGCEVAVKIQENHQ